MFGLTAAPALLFFIGMFSFRKARAGWRKMESQISARSILKKIGGENYANAATAEIQSTLASEEIQRVRFADLLEPKMRKVIVLGVVLAVFQQWCGINVIFNYAEEIFRAAGYDISTRAQEHRLDRLGESGLHLCRAGRSWIAAGGAR